MFGKKLFFYPFFWITVFSASFFLFNCKDSGKKEKTLLPIEDRFDKKTQQYAFLIPHLEPVEGVGGVKAKDCGACHTEIYKEWKQTTHANALADIQFQAEITKPSSPKWVCLNCHIPVENQRKEIVTHFENGNVLKPITKTNPNFDPEMQKEAITCATCHIRKDKEGKSYIIGPYGSELAPHPAKKDKAFLKSICFRCHNPKGEGLNKNLVCWFNTAEEMSKNQENIVKDFGEKQDCVSCHMPVVERRAVPFMTNLPIRKGSHHHWVGGGIPKWFDHYDTLIERKYYPGLEVEVEKPDSIEAGQKQNFHITLKNTKTGHDLPTADPERFISLIVKVVDENNKTLYLKKERIGQEWQWSPAKKIHDNRLSQGEKRKLDFEIDIPNELNGKKLIVQALLVRLTSKNAKHMMSAKNVDEKLFPKGQHYVSNAIDYYPFASFIYKEEINLETKENKVYNLNELIELSKAEKGKALEKREY